MTKDAQWVRRTFLVSSSSITNQEMFRRELTEAENKFTDTTLGGNFAINPPPQFTRHADIPVKGRVKNIQGMGRYYSEALDDRGQYIHMRFGIAQYNSLTNYLTNFYSTEASSLANQGRGTSIFYKAGNAIGFIVALPLMPIVWANNVVSFLSSKPASKYYYLKPTMPLYWAAVTNIVNIIGVNMGVVGKGMSDLEESIKASIDPSEGNAESMAVKGYMANTVYSDVYLPNGGIDIYAMATRAQRMAQRHREEIQQVLESGADWNSLIGQDGALAQVANGALTDNGPRTSFDNYIAKYHNTLAGKVKNKENKIIPESENVGDNFEGGVGEGDFGEYLEAELMDGSQFVTFRVDDTGTMGESFSNSTGESGLAGSLNSMASSGRETRFNFANGNLGDGFIASTIESVVGAAKDLVAGTLNGLNLQGLAAFTGNSFADIPNVWQNSSADLPKASYTIELRSPYGNPTSRFQNLMVPLSMLLAAALPISTGKQSFTSPFLVELYSKGRNQTRLGMVDSLSITRGAGNLGWTRHGEPLGIDVTFSVIDLSTVLHMPIVTSVVGGLTDSIFDDDNAYTDYMAVLGGLSLADQIYPLNKLRLRKAERMAMWEQWKSPAYHANWMAGTSLGQLTSAIMTSTLESRTQ